jgi:hypothetical protein
MSRLVFVADLIACRLNVFMNAVAIDQQLQGCEVGSLRG